ncbi:MAG: cell division protein BolA [Gammaproteobacteria bacterium CG22_combo_CG10-13_8_21_14_all_40_8]|nr:MAG: cell division protein BolA [Gammaproteobacteria bacterium CG22_combo_CG10-13_8_21_14_all_40_8]
MIEQIKSLIEEKIQPEQIEVTGDGSHFQLSVVSDVFDGLRPVQRQQKIYAIIAELIANGSVHAISIKTYTLAEWKQASKFL